MTIKPGIAGAGLFCTSLLMLGGNAFAEESFGVQAYRVRGASLLSPDEIRAATAPYTGRNRVFGDLQKAIEAIEATYRKKGFTAVEVYSPEQDITQGTIEIVVVETVIGKVAISGNRHFDNANILASLPQLAPGKTPNIRKLSENVQLANSNPAKQVETVLAVAEQPGTVNANVTVTDQNPLRLVLSGDNTGTTSTGRHRASVAVQHANLWGLDHVGTISYGTSVEEPADLRSVSASYRLPIYRWGDSVDLIVGTSKVSTSTPILGSLAPLQFVGSGSVAGLRYNQNLARSGEYVGRLVYGVDQKKFDNTCTFNAQALATAGCTDVTVRPLSITYGGQLLKPGSLLDYSVTGVQNIPAGAKGDQAAISAVRADAKAKYRILRANASWFGAVSGQWQARFALNAQYSADPLIGAESIALAGSTAVRGFEERAVATDVGAVANAELYSPSFYNTRALAFADYGAGRNLGTVVAPQVSSQSIASAGIGARFDYQKSFSFRWDGARVLKAGPANTQEKGDWRVHASALLSF